MPESAKQRPEIVIGFVVAVGVDLERIEQLSSEFLEAISKIVPDQNHYRGEFCEAKEIHGLILPSIA